MTRQDGQGRASELKEGRHELTLHELELTLRCSVGWFIDMINIIKLGFVPKTCCWVHRSGQAQSLLAM